MKAIWDMKKELRKGDSPDIKTNPCPACKGTGKIVAGYGVVCMEIVEKVEKCPGCGGNGFLEKKYAKMVRSIISKM